MQTSDRQRRKKMELERDRQGEAMQVSLTRFLGIDNRRKEGGESGQHPIEEGQCGKTAQGRGRLVGTAKSLSRFPSGGETRSQVHLVNAAPLLELRCPLCLVERLRSGGKISACSGPSPHDLSRSPGEVRLNSVVTRGLTVDTWIPLAGYLVDFHC